jgi:hypothetical protein
MNRFFTAVACAAALFCIGATGALAGEVKGPPSPCVNGVCAPNTNETQGPAHAASLCSYSGLNDYINGQTDRKVQTPKDAAPGSAAHGWEVAPGVILTCNPNGPVGG